LPRPCADLFGRSIPSPTCDVVVFRTKDSSRTRPRNHRRLHGAAKSKARFDWRRGDRRRSARGMRARLAMRHERPQLTSDSRVNVTYLHGNEQHRGERSAAALRIGALRMPARECLRSDYKAGPIPVGMTRPTHSPFSSVPKTTREIARHRCPKLAREYGFRDHFTAPSTLGFPVASLSSA